MQLCKKILIIFLIAILSNSFVKSVFAESELYAWETGIKVSDDSIKVVPHLYDPQRGSTSQEAQDVLKTKVGIILGWIRTVASIVSVVVLMIIGVKYIVGSIEQRAKYKETFYPYVIGCLMIGLGTNIVTFIYKLFIS